MFARRAAHHWLKVLSYDVIAKVKQDKNAWLGLKNCFEYFFEKSILLLMYLYQA
jgi:hypothetical protein